MTTPERRYRIRRSAAGWLEPLIDGRYVVERRIENPKPIMTMKGAEGPNWAKVGDTRTLRGAHRIVARHQRADVVWEQPGSGT